MKQKFKLRLKEEKEKQSVQIVFNKITTQKNKSSVIYTTFVHKQRHIIM